MQKPDYVIFLDACHADGTFDRLGQAVDDREIVFIERGSGARQACTLTCYAGHAGLTCSVEWIDESSPEGKLYKHVATEDLLRWNPELEGPA